MTKLTEPDVQTRMPDAKEWDRLGDMLVRTWQFATARRALDFVGHIVAVTERHDHYFDIVLNHRTVRVELSTHDAGGLTEADFRIAAELNALADDR